MDIILSVSAIWWHDSQSNVTSHEQHASDIVEMYAEIYEDNTHIQIY